MGVASEAVADTPSVLHNLRFDQTLDDLGHGRTFLANGDVDAVQFLLLIGSIVEALLVDDGIDGNGGFAENKKVVSTSPKRPLGGD